MRFFRADSENRIKIALNTLSKMVWWGSPFEINILGLKMHEKGLHIISISDYEYRANIR